MTAQTMNDTAQTYIHFTRSSSNAKTGPIPVSTSSANTCPDVCPLRGSGCYAETGPVSWHWKKVSKGLRGGTHAELLHHVQSLPKGQLWRHNAAGDLMTLQGKHRSFIDVDALQALTKANTGRKGFTYTHHDMHDTSARTWNREVVAIANNNGFTINLSANDLDHADMLADLNVGPVVTIMPEGSPKVQHTAKGRTVVQCPATYNDAITCANCGICQVATRKVIIGFPVHGVRKKAAKTVFFARIERTNDAQSNAHNEGVKV
jgi:hypothetical protein